MSKLPSTRAKGLLYSQGLQSFMAGIGGVGGGVWSLYQHGQIPHPSTPEPPTWPSYLLILWGVGLATVLFVNARAKDNEGSEKTAPNSLMGSLWMLEHLVRSHKGYAETEAKQFRATIHRVEKQEHEQCVPYVGLGSGDATKVGRRWSNHCGLVGRVIRTSEGDAQVVRMKETVIDHATYIQALIENYSYTLEQARLHEPMRLAAMAIPINDGNPHNIVGVLYCDSSDRDFFDEDTQRLCTAAGIAVAKCVKNAN